MTESPSILEGIPVKSIKKYQALYQIKMKPQGNGAGLVQLFRSLISKSALPNQHFRLRFVVY